jgi:hypothetical protein
MGSAMKRWALAPALLFLCLSSPLLKAEVPPASVGPADDADAQLFWTDAKAAYDGGHCKDAIIPLQRIIARYPSYANFTEAHLLLGRCYLSLHEPRSALQPLKYYITAKGHDIAAAEARVYLTKALLGASKKTEALLSAGELIRFKTSSGILPPELTVQGLLLKADSEIELKRGLAASKTIDAAKDKLAKSWQQFSMSERQLLSAWHGRVAIRLKAVNCDRFRITGQLDEAQTKDLFERRGLCLMDTAALFKKTVQFEAPEELGVAASLLSDSAISFASECSSPKVPTGKRSQKQVNQYKKELTAFLKPLCVAKVQDLLGILKAPASGIPASSQQILDQAATRIGKLGD